jgi:3-deoxy-7-phosphoheptulonate synthase
MRTEATQTQIASVVTRIEEQGMRAHISRGAERTVIGAIGDGRPVIRDQFILIPGVDRVVPISRPYKLASREFISQDSIFPLNGLDVKPGEILVIAGPCSVESREQIIESAYAVREAGAHALRGGAYKPRTSPYSFQGLKEDGLKMLAEARDLTGLPVVTEVMAPDQVPLVASYADVLQVGTRNMQNYALLHAVGEINKPVLLKRGMSASIDELLMAAEYVLSHGNTRLILCERGIRTFETATRNTTDINAIPVLKSRTHLPIYIDPSHGTGHWEYVNSIARAGIAAGADGLMIEVHPNPDEALSDGGQSLKPEKFAELVKQVGAIAEAVGRKLAPQPEAPNVH